MATGVLLFMLLLSVGFFGTRVATHLRIPHSVFLVLVGVAAGLVAQGRLSEYAVYFSAHFPDIILYLLLPPLIFEAAYDLDFSSFRRDLVPISALAVVGLLLSTLLVGYSLHWIFDLGLLASLTFGALISATDPVAVVALFKEVGAPRRLSTLVEGESLLNDGTAIVLFRILLLAAMSQSLSPNLLAWGAAQFIFVSLGGVLVGIFIALATNFLLRLTITSAAAQLGLTVVAAYVSFLAADRFFGMSGVIATMTVGLYLGKRAKLELNPDALAGMRHIWQFLALTANIIVFFVVGLIVDPYPLLQSLHFIPVTLAIVYVARTLSVLTTLPFIDRLKISRPISMAYQTVLVWGGLRGGLALGLVLTLPDSFPHKKLFVALAVSVVFSTLFINAVTTRRVLNILKLDQLSPIETSFFGKTIDLIRSAVFNPLLLAGQKGDLSAHLVQEQNKKYTLDHIADRSVDTRFEISAMLLRERSYYEVKLKEGALSKEGYLDLIASISERLEAFGHSGAEALKTHRLEFHEQRSIIERFWELLGRQHTFLLHRLAVRLETLLQLKFAIEESAHGLADGTAREINQIWQKAADHYLQEFYRIYPHYAAVVQSYFIVNTTRAYSEKSLRELFETGIISPGIFAKANETFAKIHQSSLREAGQLVKPSPAYLLARIPLFKELPRVAVRKLADSMKSQVLHSGQVLCEKGETIDSLYLVLAGVLEEPESKDKTRLLTGDYTDEKYLLNSIPRERTLASSGTTEVLELKQNIFKRVLDEYPTIRNRIYSDQSP